MKTNIVYAESSLMGNVPNEDGSDMIIPVRSQSNPGKFYNVDLTHGRCSCPAWTRQKGVRRPCKHLKDLGFTSVFTEDVPSPKQKSKHQIKEVVHENH